MKGGRKEGHEGIGLGGWWRCIRVWPVSPGVPVRFIFSVQGPGTAAWWDFQPCGLRCPSIHLEGCRVHSREPATQRHSHKEQPVGQPVPLIWGSQLCSVDRPTLSGTHSCQGHRLIPKPLCAQWKRRHALWGSPRPTTDSFKAQKIGMEQGLHYSASLMVWRGLSLALCVADIENMQYFSLFFCCVTF